MSVPCGKLWPSDIRKTTSKQTRENRPAPERRSETDGRTERRTTNQAKGARQRAAASESREAGLASRSHGPRPTHRPIPPRSRPKPPPLQTSRIPPQQSRIPPLRKNLRNQILPPLRNNRSRPPKNLPPPLNTKQRIRRHRNPAMHRRTRPRPVPRMRRQRRPHRIILQILQKLLKPDLIQLIRRMKPRRPVHEDPSADKAKTQANPPKLTLPKEPATPKDSADTSDSNIPKTGSAYRASDSRSTQPSKPQTANAHDYASAHNRAR